MQRCIRLLVLASAVVGFVPGLWSQTSPNSALPMPEDYFPGLKSMLADAVKQSPRMVARNTEDAIAEQNRIVARAGQLPTVGGSFSYYPWDRQYRLVDGTVGSGTRLGYNASITQPAFAWGALANNTKISTIAEKISKGQTAETYRLLVGEIRTAYLSLVMQKIALNRAQFAQKIADDNLALARSKREKNVISEGDLFGPTIAAEQARLASDRASDAYEIAKRYLAKISGSPMLADDAIPIEIPAIAPASTEVAGIAGEFSQHSQVDTYVLRNLHRQIEQERLNYKIISTRLLPKVSLSASVSQDQQRITYTQTVPYEVRDIMVGGSVNWTIFDSFSTRASKRISLARRRQLEQSYNDAQADLAQSVRDKSRQVEFSARAVAVYEKLLGSANNILILTKEDLKRGNASEAGVSSAQLNFYDAQINAFSARYDYLLKTADFLSTVMKDPALANLPAQYR